MTRKEAIGKAYGMSGTKEQHEALEFLVPEIRELREFYERQQEDERIRQELKEAFEAYDIESKWNGIPIRSIFAWLEKQKEHQFCSDAPKEKSVGGIFYSSHKDKNLDEIAQEYVDGVKKYNPEPTWDLMQTAVCYGANWQKEQFEKNRLANCDALSKEEYDRETDFAMEIIEKEHRQPTFNDAINYGMRLQKEQNPVDYDHEMWKNCVANFEGGKKEVIEHPEKYGLTKQKPEWSEDWREEDIQTRFAFYTYKNEEDDGVLYLSNVFVEESSRNHGFGTKILRAAEKVAETIGATTISLKVKQDSPANAWYRKNGYGYVAFEDGYDWLEKNLEYMKPNKQEWSEEDERMLSRCIKSVECSKQFADSETYKAAKDAEMNWLQNLSERFNLRPKNEWSEEDEKMLDEVLDRITYAFYEQGNEGEIEDDPVFLWVHKLRPSWKPSEVQMKALEAATVRYQSTGLESLYEDLKKLM